MTDQLTTRRRLPLLARGRTVPENSGAPTEFDTSTDFIGLTMLLLAMVALGVFVSWSWTFIVAFIVFMLFMHEMGHYVTARWTGMKVVEFFIGFGPRLWSFRRGETTFGVKAIPGGAYIRIIGMNNLDIVAPEDEHRTYRVKSFPRRLLVVSAGSAMHFLLAIALLFAVLFFYGLPSDDARWSVSAVSDRSAAAELGIELGDEIVSIDGVEITDFAQFGEVVTANGSQEVEVVYQRGSETLTGTVVLGSRLSDEGAAAIDGLLPRDRILAVDEIEVFGWDEVTAAVDGRFGEPLQFIVDPAGGAELLVVDEAVVLELPSAGVATSGFFGVGPQRYREPAGLFSSVTKAITGFGSYTKLILVGMGELVAGGGLQDFVADTLTGDVDSPAEQVSSSVAAEREVAIRSLDARDPDEQRIISIYGAARLGTQLTDDGFDAVLIFLAGLNISIGLINLIPLPPFDGGHVAVAIYERIRSIGGRRHRVDYAKLLPLAYGVVVLLLGVGLIAVFRDIVDPINI